MTHDHRQTIAAAIDVTLKRHQIYDLRIVQELADALSGFIRETDNTGNDEPPMSVYTIRRSSYTAAAKTSAGYGSVDFEIVAESAVQAIDKAIKDCEWRDAARNFRWSNVGSRPYEGSKR